MITLTGLPTTMQLPVLRSKPRRIAAVNSTSKNVKCFVNDSVRSNGRETNLHSNSNHFATSLISTPEEIEDICRDTFSDLEVTIGDLRGLKKVFEDYILSSGSMQKVNGTSLSVPSTAHDEKDSSWREKRWSTNESDSSDGSLVSRTETEDYRGKSNVNSWVQYLTNYVDYNDKGSIWIIQKAEMAHSKDPVELLSQCKLCLPIFEDCLVRILPSHSSRPFLQPAG